MSNAFDLDAYLVRIKWSGAIRPDLETLAGLLQAHVTNIPFENIDVLSGRGVRIDLDSLQEKLVHNRRGGYCFEHATLFGAALEAMGFKPTSHAARVIVFAPPGESPRTHMFLTVPIGDDIFIVDPGFGPYGSYLPLKLDAGDGGTHRMVRDGEHWILQTQRDGKPIPGWITTLEAENPVDFEVANYFIANSPASPFKNMLMLSALTPRGRVNVMNRDVTILRDGQATVSQLADRAALRALLKEHFGFDLPDVEQLRVPSIPDWQ